MDKSFKPLAIHHNTPKPVQKKDESRYRMYQLGGQMEGEHDNSIRVYGNRPIRKTKTIALQLRFLGRPMSDETCKLGQPNRSRAHADLSREDAETLIALLKEAIEDM